MMVDTSPVLRELESQIPLLHWLSLRLWFIFEGSVVALFSKNWTKIKMFPTFLLLYSIQFCVGSAKLWKKIKKILL